MYVYIIKGCGNVYQNNTCIQTAFSCLDPHMVCSMCKVMELSLKALFIWNQHIHLQEEKGLQKNYVQLLYCSHVCFLKTLPLVRFVRGWMKWSVVVGCPGNPWSPKDPLGLGILVRNLLNMEKGQHPLKQSLKVLLRGNPVITPKSSCCKVQRTKSELKSE